MTNEEIKAQAVVFAKKNKMRIAREFTNPLIYVPDIKPVSVFMAGSPGAGKTEYSKNLIEIIEGNMKEGKQCRVIRIDADDIRSLIPGYTGKNSQLFQGAVSLIVEKIHDIVLHNRQNFILDGTFSKYEKAKDNIIRSLNKTREVVIFYVYQKPETAWKLTQAREVIEGRNIPKQAFIGEFLGARETIKKIAGEFRDKLTIFFAEKDFEKNTENVVQIDLVKGDIDSQLGRAYTGEELEKLL
jgi:glutaredoxin-related protein